MHRWLAVGFIAAIAASCDQPEVMQPEFGGTPQFDSRSSRGGLRVQRCRKIALRKRRSTIRA